MLKIIDRSAIEGLDWFETTIPADLRRRAPIGPNLPHFLPSRSIGAEINGAPILRPSGKPVDRRLNSQASGLASLGADHEDVRVSGDSSFKYDPAVIRRPGRRPHLGRI